MRTTRMVMGGFGTSLGTSGTMVAASACLFFVASTLIAFNSWSGLGLSGRIESLFVGDARPSFASQLPGPQVVAANAAAAAASVARAGGDGSATAPRGGASDAGAERFGPSSTIAPVQSTPGVDVSVPVALPPLPDLTPPPLPDVELPAPELPQLPAEEPPNAGVGGILESTTDTLAGTVGDTTGQLGGTLGAIDPFLGTRVASTGQTLDGTILGAGQAVGGLLPPGT